MKSVFYKIHPKIRLLGLLGLTFVTTSTVSAQSARPLVKIKVATPSEIEIQIENLTPTSSWSFLNSYAGALGLGDRIERFQTLRSNESVAVKKVASGEFRSPTPANVVRYVVRPSTYVESMPHVSGMTEEFGVLLPSDLLPEALSKTELEIDFDLPNGWQVESSLDRISNNHFLLQNPERDVFLVGRDLRVLPKSIEGMQLRILVSGRWEFSDKSILRSASQVLEHYYSMVGFKLRQSPTIVLAQLPFPASNSWWKAETRGSTVTLLLKPGMNLKNWTGQLGVIFTHEIFHLWVPNSLALKGDYDWFFEGFTMYVALQSALKLKLIDFQEYLNTLGRVYHSYLSNADDQTVIQASSSRWTSSNSLIYDKGMLVAFIYDLTLRSNTKNKLSLADQYRTLFGAVDEPANANDVIITLLTSSPATRDFGKLYIESRERINLERVLPPFGFQVNGQNKSVLTVRRDLTDEQKSLMQLLGYRR